jgi:hypothetical protein
VIENILYFSYPEASAPLTLAECVSFANSLMGSMETHLQGNLSPAVTMEGVVVTDLDTATGFEGNSTAAPWAGTNSGGPTPPGSAIVTTLDTATRGRSFRGRTYLAGLPATDVNSSGQWLAAAVANISLGWLDIATAMAGLTLPFVQQVVSFYSGKEANPNPLSNRRNIPMRRATPVATPVVSWTAKAQIASQRRRNLVG